MYTYECMYQYIERECGHLFGCPIFRSSDAQIYCEKKTLRTHLRMCSFVLTFHIAPKFKNKLYEKKNHANNKTK